MGCELLSEEHSTKETPKTGAEVFREMFPFYLSIGMSHAEYWDGDPSLPRYYRKAYLMKQEQDNQKAWLQGLYFYNALGATMSQCFPEKGKEGTPYLSKPIDFSNKEKPKEAPRMDEDAEAKLAEVWMNRMCRAYKNVGAKPR